MVSKSLTTALETRIAEIQLSALHFSSILKKKREEVSPSSAPLIRERTHVPAASAKSKAASWARNCLYNGMRDTTPSSTLPFGWRARAERMERDRDRSLRALLTWRTARLLRCSLPRSHKSWRDGKERLRNLHLGQKSLTALIKAGSLRIETFSFHLPGPWGMGSGIEQPRKTASWSEKGHGTIEQDDTRWNQIEGTPMRSIREDKEPSGFSQV